MPTPPHPAVCAWCVGCVWACAGPDALGAGRCRVRAEDAHRADAGTPAPLCALPTSAPLFSHGGAPLEQHTDSSTTSLQAARRRRRQLGPPRNLSNLRRWRHRRPSGRARPAHAVGRAHGHVGDDLLPALPGYAREGTHGDGRKCHRDRMRPSQGGAYQDARLLAASFDVRIAAVVAEPMPAQAEGSRGARGGGGGVGGRRRHPRAG